MLMIAGRITKSLRLALLTFVPLVLSGCESLPALTDIFPDSRVDQVAAPTVADGRAERTREETHELRQAIDLLQDGRLQQGRAGIVSFLRRNPGNPTARSLLRQIDSDPTALLGEEHTFYTVRPGDTLSELADRFLGNAISFLVLARYNDIQRPRVLYVGQALKIPLTRGRGAEDVAPAEESAVKAAVEPAIAPAVALDPAAEQGEGPTHVDTPVTSVGSAALPAEPATSVIEETSPTVEAAETAIDDVGPNFDSAAPAAGATAEAGADAALIAQYHQAAVVHFRNQELEEAITLWDRVLALDPGFEAARGYRMRAQELKRRLEALETR